MNSKYKPVIEQFDAYQGGKRIPYYRYQIPQNAYKTVRFLHKTHSVLSTGDFVVSDTHTSGEFTAEKAECKGLFETRFQMLTSDAESSNQGVNEFVNLARLFLLPTKDLHFSLDKNGGIDKVLNKESVVALWQELYQFLASEMTNEELLKSVRQKGDKEFGRISDSVRGITLYALYFFPVFNREFTFDAKHSILFTPTSQFVPEEMVQVELMQKEVRTEQYRIYFSFEGETSDEKIPKKAKEIFGEQLKEKSRHLLKLDLNYTLDMETGYPLLIRLHSKELLGDLLCNEQTTEIELLERPEVQPEEPPYPSSAGPDQKTNDSKALDEEPFHSWILDDDSFA